MKAFEKWDEQNKINFATISSGELSVQNERRMAWKAALEWVKKEAISHDEHGDSNRTVINQELENKKQKCEEESCPFPEFLMNVGCERCPRAKKEN